MSGFVFTDEMKRKMPDPVFGCAFDCCSQEVSYPADCLFWSEEEGQWICESCAEALGVRVSRFSLADVQKVVGWVRPDWQATKQGANP